jgi:hypothetical protein
MAVTAKKAPGAPEQVLYLVPKWFTPKLFTHWQHLLSGRGRRNVASGIVFTPADQAARASTGGSGEPGQ